MRATVWAACAAFCVGGALPAAAVDLRDLIESSIGYVNVAPGVVLIETETLSYICAFTQDGGPLDAVAFVDGSGEIAYACRPLSSVKER